MCSEKVQVEGHIKASAEEVYDFLTNPSQIPLVLPGLIENSDIPDLPLKVGDSFTYRYQVAGVVFEGKWIVSVADRPSRYSAKTVGGADSEWTYTMRGGSDGTNVVLTVKYVAPQSLLDKISVPILRRINQHDSESLMNNLKVVLEFKNG